MKFLGLLPVLLFFRVQMFQLCYCFAIFYWFRLSSFVSFADLGDVKASIAVISLIVSNAAKFDVSGDVLSNELQQLGLPKGDHSNISLDLWLRFDTLK